MPIADVAEDLLQLAAIKLPSDIDIADPGRNAWASDEIASKDGGVPVASTFFETAGGPVDGHSDGINVEHRVVVTVRSDRGAKDAARAKATRILNALHRNGAFTGSSGVPYVDVLAEDANPVHTNTDLSTGCAYFTLSFLVRQVD